MRRDIRSQCNVNESLNVHIDFFPTKRPPIVLRLFVRVGKRRKCASRLQRNYVAATVDNT